MRNAGRDGGADPGGAGVTYCFIGFDGEGLLVELSGDLDARPWTQVGVRLASVPELDEGDLCFYCLVRTPGGFAASEENGLVADFKLDPARFRRRPEVWRCKEAASEAFAGAVARLLGRDGFQLYPMLRLSAEKPDLESLMNGAERFIADWIQPQGDGEREYLERFAAGDYRPELVFGDERMARAATVNPETLWKLENLRKM